MTPKKLIAELKARGVRVALAESCTGGLVAAALTAVPGSSDVFDRGFVTYSNESKHELLGVPKALLKRHGAVSEQVAKAMAKGALARSNANIAIAVTGIAGPGGGTPDKPVGLVYLAGAVGRQKPFSARINLGDLGRNNIRKISVEYALGMLEGLLLRENIFGTKLKG